MADIVDEARRIVALRGDTYSSYEVLGVLGRAAAEIERLRAALEFYRDPFAWKKKHDPEEAVVRTQECEGCRRGYRRVWDTWARRWEHREGGFYFKCSAPGSRKEPANLRAASVDQALNEQKGSQG